MAAVIGGLLLDGSVKPGCDESSVFVMGEAELEWFIFTVAALAAAATAAAAAAAAAVVLAPPTVDPPPRRRRVGSPLPSPSALDPPRRRVPKIIIIIKNI